jgi:hypothetical protein
MLTAHLNLVPRLRMSGAIPPVILHVLMAWTGTAVPFHFRLKRFWYNFSRTRRLRIVVCVRFLSCLNASDSLLVQQFSCYVPGRHDTTRHDLYPHKPKRRTCALNGIPQNIWGATIIPSTSGKTPASVISQHINYAVRKAQNSFSAVH